MPEKGKSNMSLFSKGIQFVKKFIKKVDNI